MSDFNIYALEEQISEMEYITATYYCEFPEDIDIVAKAKSFAVGQTIGTWLPVPGVTPEMREKHKARRAEKRAKKQQEKLDKTSDT